MTIQVLGALIISDQTKHSARSVGHGGWVVSWLPGRTVTGEQAVAAIQLAENVAALTALATLLGLPPCEAVGKAALDFRLIDGRTVPVPRSPGAYALLRTDKSEHVEAVGKQRLGDLAEHLGFELRDTLVAESDTDFATLFASFELSGITALLVPSVLHMTGWMDVVRHHVDVWTLDPPGRWPRHCTPGGATPFLPGLCGNQ